MRSSSPSSTSTSTTGNLHATQNQPQDDYGDDAPARDDSFNDLDEADNSDSSESVTDDETLDGRRSVDISSPGRRPSPSGQASSPIAMTAGPVLVGGGGGSVLRPPLTSSRLRQSYTDDDVMEDSDQETDSDMEIDSDSDQDADTDVNGGALLAAAHAAPLAFGAEASDSQMDNDSEFDSEYESDDVEDDELTTEAEYYNHLGAMQPLFSVIPLVAQPTFMAGPFHQSQQHIQTQPQSQTHTHNHQANAPHPQLQPDTDIQPTLANLPPLPQPPPDWTPLPPMIGGDLLQNPTISNANPSILGSENFGLVDFLHDWALQSRYGRAARSLPPHLPEVAHQAQTSPTEVDYSDLEGDACDMQGLDWSAMETSRQAARLRRRYTYRNYVNRQGSDKWVSQMEGPKTMSNGSFFRFKRMNIRKDISLAHFQLRSVLACPTRTHAYYPSLRGITRLNTASRKSDLFMNLRDFPANGAVISTVDANCGVLMCGTFNGDYCMKSLNSSDKQAYAEGRITDDVSGITNHIKIHQSRRSASPVAAIASNDHGFRLLDLETQKFTQETIYPFALNCTALSPDRRLRAVVGDDFNVFITNADTGEVQRELSGHRDYGFACDWSDDGWTVATGFQDMAVKIWDARRWCNSSGISTPLCTVRTEMAGARSLRFSPVGGGRPVLVAAEEADYVNIIDAKTFRRKQIVDVFGEIGGVSFANEGHDLNVLCCDSHRGGLLQLERCGQDFVSSGLETPAHEMPTPF